MSQEKVDRYKKEKANRKENIKKEKRKSNLYKFAGILVALAIVAWLGNSAYGFFFTNNADKGENITVDMDAVNEYMSGINE